MASQHKLAQSVRTNYSNIMEGVYIIENYVASCYYNTGFWWRKTLVNLVNHWWFTKIIFTIQILTKSHDIYKESKQAGIYQSFNCQKFLDEKIISSPKLLCYTVFSLLRHQLNQKQSKIARVFLCCNIIP